jgi:hypothetical protein
MRYRKLRIAWSVGWGTACVLLIVLWVRSYWWAEIFSYTNRANVFVGVRFERGILQIYRGNVRPIGPGWNHQLLELPASTFRAFYSSWKNGYGMTQVQDWFPVLVSAVFAIRPWMRQLSVRFSLRTLLIATTLVAVVLGLIVWLSR